MPIVIPFFVVLIVYSDFFIKFAPKCMYFMDRTITTADDGKMDLHLSHMADSSNDGIATQYVSQQQQSMTSADNLVVNENDCICPFCGNIIDQDADYCESCHRYIKNDICSFCGTKLDPNEQFCHECGGPKGGLVCPVCNTLNEFAFCKKCGIPLTEEASSLVQDIHSSGDFALMASVVEELEKLDLCLPYLSEKDKAQDELNNQFRAHVLKLLAADRGVEYQHQYSENDTKRMSAEELEKAKQEKFDKIAQILERLSFVHAESPVKARNYAMATKPRGVRMVWKCNYKNAMHSSPCGCAKPHLGGKWVLLDGKSTSIIKDDDRING